MALSRHTPVPAGEPWHGQPLPVLFHPTETVVGEVARLVALLTGARRASLLLTGEGDQVWLAAALGVPLRSGQPVALAPGVAVEALRTGIPILSQDLALSPFPTHPERGYATASCMAVPVLWQGSIHGVICAADPADGSSFTPENLVALRVLADHIGGCIHAVAAAGALADTDGLTGVQTRRAFERSLAVEAERSRRFGRPLSLLMLDIDNLKRINDTEGHRAGDQVLSCTARTLLETVRRVDLVARYSDDEFAVLLPETGVAESLTAAQRVAMSLSQATQAGNVRLVASLRASMGAATLPPAAGAEELLDQASRALHLAKGDRGRVRHWSQDAAAPGCKSHPCTCAFCGRSFLVDTPHRQETRRYCSKRCAAGARRLENQDRNSAIVSQRASGETLQAIAGRYGLSIERVRQICATR